MVKVFLLPRLYRSVLPAISLLKSEYGTLWNVWEFSSGRCAFAGGAAQWVARGMQPLFYCSLCYSVQWPHTCACINTGLFRSFPLRTTNMPPPLWRLLAVSSATILRSHHISYREIRARLLSLPLRVRPHLGLDISNVADFLCRSAEESVQQEHILPPS